MRPSLSLATGWTAATCGLSSGTAADGRFQVRVRNWPRQHGGAGCGSGSSTAGCSTGWVAATCGSAAGGAASGSGGGRHGRFRLRFRFWRGSRLRGWDSGNLRLGGRWYGFGFGGGRHGRFRLRFRFWRGSRLCGWDSGNLRLGGRWCELRVRRRPTRQVQAAVPVLAGQPAPGLGQRQPAARRPMVRFRVRGRPTRQVQAEVPVLAWQPTLAVPPARGRNLGLGRRCVGRRWLRLRYGCCNLVSCRGASSPLPGAARATFETASRKKGSSTRLDTAATWLVDFIDAQLVGSRRDLIRARERPVSPAVHQGFADRLVVDIEPDRGTGLAASREDDIALIVIVDGIEADGKTGLGLGLGFGGLLVFWGNGRR